MNGILVMDKPQNYTSFDIIAILRKKLNQKKIGHMGTLDPMATGVLPILLGKTAKFQSFTQQHDKEYLAEIKFGITTNTQDRWGKISSFCSCYIKKEHLENIVRSKFTGNILQIPPMYSAIKQNGVKLCNIARLGKEVKRTARNINIKSIEIISFDEKNQCAQLLVLCSQGTYIRSLCFDIGKALGCGAVMGELRRTLSNSFTISQSVSLSKIQNLSIEDIKKTYIRPTDDLFKKNKSLNITPAQSRIFKNGVNLMLSRLYFENGFEDNEIFKIYCNKIFIGIGKVDKKNEVLKYLKCEDM